MSIKREFEIVNSVNPNFKTNSQSKDIKLLPNAALLVGEYLPQDHNIVIKENENVNKCIELTGAIRTEHKVKTETVTLVIGALGSVSKQIKTSIDLIDTPDIIGSAQISTITSTFRDLI